VFGEETEEDDVDDETARKAFGILLMLWMVGGMMNSGYWDNAII